VLAALGEHLTNAEIADRLFISVRTVESHVSSLLRKLQLSDRRALAVAAANLEPARPAGLEWSAGPGNPDAGQRAGAWAPERPAAGGQREVAWLPAPLTSFVGRAAERAALAAALREHRMVTAVGPGGVGKTRLALSVVADVTGQYADGAWYVDLVPVTDPAMVAPAIAAALGLGERQGRSSEDIVLGWLASRQALLILDNCEHLLDGMPALVERLLAGSPRLSVLLTSRARLLVPFEWVFPVPGLSTPADGRPGDAVELFAARTAAGGSQLAPGDMDRVAAICRGLDGMALAIELTAARFPSLGLDGIEAGLADRMNLLAGGRRADDRHRSLRSALDWSYALLAPEDQAVLRRLAVFAAPFTAAAAEVVCAGWPPADGGVIAAALARLADQSLLVAVADGTGTRYRALETIRQYGARQLGAEGEAVQAAARHLGWCLDAAAALGLPARDDRTWRAAFDQLADELRAALRWAADQGQPQAYPLAMTLAELTFARGLPGESQRRYEQAAELAADAGPEAIALRWAAGAAKARHAGDDALRLHEAAAEAAIRAGDRSGAAGDLAEAAEMIGRAPGLMATAPAPGQAQALLAQGWALALADRNPVTEARLLAAEAYSRDELDPVTAELTDRAITLAGRTGDPLTESAALDELSAVQLAWGEPRAALASTLRRLEILSLVPMTARSAIEHADSLYMATECATAAGDLRTAHDLAERIRNLPFQREEGHLATARLIVVAALAGDWDEAVGLARQFREGWERAGQPRAGNLSRGAYAAATVHGLRGDDEARAAWLDIVDALATPGRPLSEIHFNEFFDALLLLHQGHPDRAMRLLTAPPEHFRTWYSALWKPWYAALWAEAAVLTGHRDAAARIRRARLITADNPIAAAIVARAEALAGDRGGLVAAAAALEAAGCRYQWARTLVAIGGTERARGEAALAAMGATVMAWPRG
jgi:predicted ATPase